MDAVELNYQVDVAAPKLIMGSEGFGRAAGVTVKGLEACELDRVSVLASPSIERCSSSLIHKDVASAVNASNSASWDKIPNTELFRHASQLPSCQSDIVSEQLLGRGTNSLLSTSRPRSVELQRKTGNVSRSNSVCFKRPRIAQLEDSTSLAGVDDIKDISTKLGSYPKKCTSPETTPLVKQKNNYNGKRGDRRSVKGPPKNKYDSFPLKAGSANFSAAAGGNYFLGAYGLKSDVHDVTKLVGDLSLNELLDGTCESPSLGKDKGKKVSNTNENILHSVKKACSILQLLRPAQPQNFAEVDNCSNKKVSTCLSSTVTSGCNGDKGDSCTTDLSSCTKIQDSCSKPESPANPLDFPLYQPNEILERLALPPPKDLESLLLDAAKPAVSSRNTPDLRSGKQISRGASLPPFSWSHTFSGHCRTNSDVVKLSASRSTCQGRWARIGNTSSSLGIATDCFTDLESLGFDPSLIPLGGLDVGLSVNKIAQSGSVTQPSELVSSSSATCSKGSHIRLETGGETKCDGNAGHCPRLLAAAQTLYDLATCSPRQNPDGMIRWSKKPSQKTTKARKLKSNEKLEEIYMTPMSGLGSDNVVRSVDQIMPSKKPRLSMIGDKKDLEHTNSVRRGPINWSMPRSSRSSPSRSVRDVISETRHAANIVKQSCMMPPPARVLDKACNSEQKLRKLVPIDWKRGRERVD